MSIRCGPESPLWVWTRKQLFLRRAICVHDPDVPVLAIEHPVNIAAIGKRGEAVGAVIFPFGDFTCAALFFARTRQPNLRGGFILDSNDRGSICGQTKAKASVIVEIIRDAGDHALRIGHVPNLGCTGGYFSRIEDQSGAVAQPKRSMDRAIPFKLCNRTLGPAFSWNFD